MLSKDRESRQQRLRSIAMRGLCWGGWIRTTDYLIQSQEPYRLATPQGAHRLSQRSGARVSPPTRDENERQQEQRSDEERVDQPAAQADDREYLDRERDPRERKGATARCRAGPDHGKERRERPRDDEDHRGGEEIVRLQPDEIDREENAQREGKHK